MTGTYNRISKNRNLIPFFVIALLLHVMVFRIPVKDRVASRLCQAISVSVVPSKEPATIAPPAREATRPILKSAEHPEPALPPASKVASPRPSMAKVIVPREPEKKQSVVTSRQEAVTQRPPEIHPETDPEEHGDLSGAFSSLEPETSNREKGPEQLSESAVPVKEGTQGFDHKEASPLGDAEGAVTYAMPKYKENPPPPYPRMAKRRGYEGRTVLDVEVLEDGKVGSIVISESSGYEILDRAALKSVKEWAFVPGTTNGKQVRQRVMVPVRFDLN